MSVHQHHSFVHENLQPLLALQAEHRIVMASFGGLSPTLRSREGDEKEAAARASLAVIIDKLAAVRSGERNCGAKPNAPYLLQY